MKRVTAVAAVQQKSGWRYSNTNLVEVNQKKPAQLSQLSQVGPAGAGPKSHVREEASPARPLFGPPPAALGGWRAG